MRKGKQDVLNLSAAAAALAIALATASPAAADSSLRDAPSVRHSGSAAAVVASAASGMPRTALAWPVATAAVTTAALEAPDDIKLNSTGRTMTIVVPVKDGANYLGDVDVQITPDDTILVSIDRLVELLTPRIGAAKLSEIRDIAPPEGFAPLSDLAERGVPVQFDKRMLEMTVVITTGDRALQTIGLTATDPTFIGDFAQPESFSAFVNIRSSLDYVHKGTQTGFGDPFVLFDGAARIGRVVLEAEGEYNGMRNQFRRNGTRLVYDDAKRLARWTAGDLLPESRGFQGVVNMAGLGISRSYAILEPQRNVAPRGGRTFSLERGATVEAIVNGRTVRVLRLQPGTYNVSDFPFAQGGNDVQLVIVDDTGRRDVISFTTFIERTQLAAGLSEYNLNIGVIADRFDGINYSNDLALSGFYRRGLTDNLTVGGNAQYANKAYLVGTEAVMSTGWGTIGGDFAFSYIPSTGSGWAANFSLERMTQNAAGTSSLVATIETRSRRFGAPGQLAPDNPYSYNLVLSYNRSLGTASFIGGEARYARGRNAFADERSLRASFGHRLDRVTNVVLDGEWSRGVRGEDKSVRVSLVRRFGPRTSARAEYDTRDNRARLGIQSSGGYGVGAWSGVANVDFGRDTHSINASGNYVANRADVGLAHTAAYSQQSNSIVDQRTSLRVGSSIAFTGGSFAVGRPISDSFAIIRSYKSDKKSPIEVEPSQGSYQARSGTFGPALYGQLGSYSPRTLTYDVPEASAGLDIGTGSLRVLAPYRSGYVVTVGSDYNVMAVGRLTADDGSPLELRAGYATEIGGGERRVELFTNRQGRFGISGVKAGRWRIEISGSPPIIYELDIPEAEAGVARVGDISPTDER